MHGYAVAEGAVADVPPWISGLVQEAATRGRLYGRHVLSFPAILDAVVAFHGLGDYVRVLLVAIALPRAGVVLGNRAATCKLPQVIWIARTLPENTTRETTRIDWDLQVIVRLQNFSHTECELSKKREGEPHNKVLCKNLVLRMLSKLVVSNTAQCARYHSSCVKSLRFSPPLSLRFGPHIDPLCSMLVADIMPFLWCFLLPSPREHCSRNTKITTRATMRRADTTPIKMLVMGVKRNPERWFSVVKFLEITQRITMKIQECGKRESGGKEAGWFKLPWDEEEYW